MVNSGTSLIHPTVPPTLQPLNQSDLLLIERVREELVQRGINPPSWREADSEKRRRFYDEVRSILIDQGENRSSVNRNAQIITDALSGVGLLDQLLRDPYVEEIFVRNGVVAVEYDGSFYHLGKLADDSYFENLAVHVADQGGATLRGDRPAVLIDLPGGERFTAIVPRELRHDQTVHDADAGLSARRQWVVQLQAGIQAGFFDLSCWGNLQTLLKVGARKIAGRDP